MAMATVLKLTLYMTVLAFAALASAAGRPVPTNLQKLYNHAKACATYIIHAYIHQSDKHLAYHNTNGYLHRVTVATPL